MAGTVIILGIDPGMGNTGWGVVRVDGSRYTCVGFGCITTPPGEDHAHRLRLVHDAVCAIVREHVPDEAAIEQVYFGTNARTAMVTGEARGAALVALAGAGLPIEEYGPGEIKQAVVGSGSADKRQIAYMMRAILGLSSEPKPEHAADALAVAVCHANLRVHRARERVARSMAGGSR